jgi:hypothetical protein
MNPHILDTNLIDQELLQDDAQTLVRSDIVGHGPSPKSSMRRRGRSSACADWLRQHGLSAYPDKVQLHGLALMEGKTLKQVKVSLSNLRARERRSEMIQSLIHIEGLTQKNRAASF